MLRTCTWPYHLSSAYLMLVLSLAPLLGLVLMYLVLLGQPTRLFAMEWHLRLEVKTC